MRIILSGKYLVFLIVSVCRDVLFGTDGVSVKVFTQQAEEPSDGQQELRTCSKTQAAHFKATAGAKRTCRSLFTWGTPVCGTCEDRMGLKMLRGDNILRGDGLDGDLISDFSS